MTEAQKELYEKTKRRLRRLGAENPADVIVALAEEIEGYRKKIQSMEEYIASRSPHKQCEGEWIRNRQTSEYICSLCGAIGPVDCLKEDFYESNYCPNCGAKMKGGMKPKHIVLWGTAKPDLAKEVLKEIMKEIEAKKGGK